MLSLLYRRACVSPRLRASVILGLALCVAASPITPAQPPQDALDRALARVGLTKATARFDADALDTFGGGEFQLNFWRALHRDPYKIPYYSQVTSAQLRGMAPRLGPIISHASGRVDELIRRDLVDDPLAPMMKKVAQPDALAAAVGAVCAKGGKPLDDDARKRLHDAASVVPPAVARQAALILYASADAYGWRQRAFAAAARRFDLQKLYEQALAEPDPDRDDLDHDLYDLMHLIDLKALFAGAQDLALAIDRAVPDLAKFNGDDRFSFRWETPLGLVEINGAANDNYPAGIKRLLTLDTGGDDTYEAGGATLAADNPVSVLIDLRGNDTYKSTDRKHPSFGAGVLGYGFLVDLSGNDTYTAVNLTQGAASFGVGCLLDLAGDDRYMARVHAQGTAEFGIGLLVDVAGKDRYEGFVGIQGCGYTKGFGLLMDLAGDDEYVANDTKIDFPSPQTPEHNANVGQGCGMGRRADYTDGRSLAGGIGILLDAQGNDTYTGGLFVQGTGFWYGVGMLLDEQGDDRYSGVWYVQAAAAHDGVGILVDGAGNDHYKATMNVALGAGHDFSVGFLLDRGGNDTYEAPSLSLGAGNANGIGIFWDMGGDDTYKVSGGLSMGAANYEATGLRPSILCLGVFVDSGGGRDTYPAGSRAANGTAWTQPHPKDALPGALLKGVGLDE
jgi:hypothetical protein